jgi:hypothetical protein
VANLLAYLFSWSAWWVWTGLAAAVAGLLYANGHHSFALTDLAYRLPIVGKLTRYSKDYSLSSDEGWLNVENTLCADYARHLSALSKGQFDNNIQYLKKTYDHGRREMPSWALGLLTLLVVLEGFGFSYLLGSFVSAESSENLRELLMVGIVLVLAAILVWVTHSAGHQLFRTSLLRNCFREFQADTHVKAKEGQPQHAFCSRLVSLDERQSVDNGEPAHVQCANRVVSKPGDLGSYAWVWAAAALIIAIAIGSTLLRIETLQTSLVEDAQGPGALFGGGGAPKTDPAAASKQYAAMTGFVMLAVIFIVTQLVGIGVGFRYGFAGKQSREAYRNTRGSADYASYWAPVQTRINIANARLSKLHQLLEKNSPRPLEFTKTFFDFIRREQERGARDLHLPPGYHEGTEGAEAEPPAPSRLNGAGPGETAQHADHGIDEPQIEIIARRLHETGDEERALAYLATLAPEVRVAVRARLIAMKADREQIRDDFQGLL